MGDRTNVLLYLDARDAELAREHMPDLVGDELRPADPSTGLIEIERDEVNGGGYDERLQAAEFGVRFYGYHGAGAEYWARNFAAFGGLLCECDGGDDGPVVPVDIETGEVNYEALQEVRRVIEVRATVRRVAAKAAEVAIVNAHVEAAERERAQGSHAVAVKVAARDATAALNRLRRLLGEEVPGDA